MSNDEHHKILKKGDIKWNSWRDNSVYVIPQLSEINLYGQEFKRYDFTNCNFTQSNLSNCGFIDCIFTYADLSGSDLTNTDFSGCDMWGANFTDCNGERIMLVDANLTNAKLTNTNLSGADLYRTNFLYAELRNTDFTNSDMFGTILVGTNLNSCIGLETVGHAGPSFLDFVTLNNSGELPIEFLRGIGLPDNYINYLPDFNDRAIQIASCFISYSHKDESFARKLFEDLQKAGVRCWYAPEDLKSGQKIHSQIFEAIQIHDKLLLILSENSIKSNWVHSEIKRAKKRERIEKRQILFPIVLTKFEEIMNWELFDADTGLDLANELREYYLPNFENWKNELHYQNQLKKLLGSLKQ